MHAARKIAERPTQFKRKSASKAYNLGLVRLGFSADPATAGRRQSRFVCRCAAGLTAGSAQYTAKQRFQDYSPYAWDFLYTPFSPPTPDTVARLGECEWF